MSKRARTSLSETILASYPEVFEILDENKQKFDKEGDYKKVVEALHVVYKKAKGDDDSEEESDDPRMVLERILDNDAEEESEPESEPESEEEESEDVYFDPRTVLDLILAEDESDQESEEDTSPFLSTCSSCGYHLYYSSYGDIAGNVAKTACALVRLGKLREDEIRCLIPNVDSESNWSCRADMIYEICCIAISLWTIPVEVKTKIKSLVEHQLGDILDSYGFHDSGIPQWFTVLKSRIDLLSVL